MYLSCSTLCFAKRDYPDTMDVVGRDDIDVEIDRYVRCSPIALNTTSPTRRVGQHAASATWDFNKLTH